MKLSKKTFFYSISISALLVGMIVIYFVTMLPSLYVDYMNKQYLESVVAVEKGYMEKRSYEGLAVQNPTGSATLELPFAGDEFYLAGKAFRLTITVQDDNIRRVLSQLRDCLRRQEDLEWESLTDIEWELLWKTLRENRIFENEAPLSVDISIQEENDEMRDSGTGKLHFMGQDIIVFEANAEDGENQYTTYIAMGQTEDALILSFLPMMTPQMREIKNIVLGSVPMIAAVLFFIVLICSRYFSAKIVNPVIRLANYAETVKYAQNLEIEPLPVAERDEIGELGRTLNELYEKLRKNYAQLEEKNNRLEKENKRQEVFLRASSHQLKTPVAAALLLVDGMMGEVGKYKDTKKYLPQVKMQLLSMRKMIEDILYLNHCTENLQREKINVNVLIQEILGSYDIQITEKELHCSLSGENTKIVSDRELLKKLLDNLISNAVAYTETGGSIEIEIKGDSLSILNRKAHIDEKLLPHIYEPFVSGNTGQRGKGLGLYIAVYYCEVLGCRFSLENTSEGVLAALMFCQIHTPSSYGLHTEALE